MSSSYIYTNSKKPLLMFIKSLTHLPPQVEQTFKNKKFVIIQMAARQVVLLGKPANHVTSYTDKNFIESWTQF